MSILQSRMRHSAKQRLHVELLESRMVLSAMQPHVAALAAVSHGADGVSAPVAVAPVHESSSGLAALRGERAVERRELRLERRALRLAGLYEIRHHITLAAPAANQVVSSAPLATATSGSAASSAPGNAVPTAIATSLQGSVTSPGSMPTLPVATTSPSSGSQSSGSSAPAQSPATTQTPLPANVGQQLDAVYAAYESGTLSPTTQPGQPVIQGTSVEVQIHTSVASDFNLMVSDAEALGLQVNGEDSASNLVTGFLPISALPSAAQLPDSPSVMAVDNPMFS
jgi:hypothetical protein